MSSAPNIVLVLEDELPLQNAIRQKLEKNNFQVVTARSVEQARNHLSDLERVDVIWVDHYLLGKENGLDFVNEIKNHEAWKKIPIFVVSNTASEDKIKAYLALGVEKYFTKADYRLDVIIGEMQKAIDQGL